MVVLLLFQVGAVESLLWPMTSIAYVKLAIGNNKQERRTNCLDFQNKTTGNVPFFLTKMTMILHKKDLLNNHISAKGGYLVFHKKYLNIFTVYSKYNKKS